MGHTIAVSRALGDIYWKDSKFTAGQQTGLIAEPHLNYITLERDKDEFMILACDGLWDVFSYQSACDYVTKKLKSYNDPQLASQKLVEKALEIGSTDNITCCIVTFRDWKAENK
jgi:serine/threonine protein phosphatase PrpC